MFCLNDNIAICSMCLKLHKYHDIILDEVENTEREIEKKFKSICSTIKDVQ